MSWFISTHQDIFRGKSVLELGAGAGLAGFVASQISQKTLITDGNEVFESLRNT
jgi:predicted nicotinamide N-methyase